MTHDGERAKEKDSGGRRRAGCCSISPQPQLKSEKPDLVTLDISMPEKSGVRFYREVKQDAALKDIPAVIVTGVESTQDGGTGSDFQRFLSTRKSIPPPDGFITKPIEKAELLGAVKKCLGE